MVDFYTALRSRARSQERQARLTGRPLTQAEATAPYVALAETAGERLRAGKSVELAERGQVAQESQFGQQLEEQRIARAESSRLEQIRIDEAKRAAEAREAAEADRLKEAQRVTNLQVQAAKEAGEGSPITSGATGALTGGYVGGTYGTAIGTAIGGSASAAAGAAAGATSGAAATAWSGPGMIVGAIVGAAIGMLSKKGCIIISACTDPYSYEVNLAREFRDRYMGPETLTGYYAIAPIVAAAINKYRIVRWFIYHGLVRHLVDFGEWVFERKPQTTRPLSKTISKAFLKLCGFIGRRMI